MKSILLQPCYFGDIAYYAHVVQNNPIKIEVHDNYQKQTYRNRCIIGTANGTLTLTIPVKHTGSKGHKKTSNAIIENNFHWQKEHWRSIQIAYRTSPFFEFYEDDIKFLFTETFTNLLEFNLKTFDAVLDILQIEKDISQTESYEKEPEIFDGRFLANAKEKRSVELPEYMQVFDDKNGFIPHLSILDLIFNLGPQALTYLEELDLN